MNGRRPVRVDPRFLEQLDAGLGEERRSTEYRRASTSSSYPQIEDDFALRFEELSGAIPGRPDYRQAITTGRLIPVMIAIVGQLSASVLLLGVELHRRPAYYRMSHSVRQST